MNFIKWLDTFLDEKGIDLEESFTLKSSKGTDNIITYGVIVEHIKISSPEEQKQIKEVIVQIDFKNGDVKHFLKHLGQGLIEHYGDFY